MIDIEDQHAIFWEAALWTLVAVIAVSFWIFWIFLERVFSYFGVMLQPGELGQWGDSFGALNTLFAGLAFSAVVFTIRQQQKQIKNAQLERKQERFEHTFFELLRLLREARDEVRFRHSPEVRENFSVPESTASGRTAFRNAWREVDHLIDDANLTESQVANIYEDRVHSRYDSSFGPYFRILYTILERIKEESSIDINERYQYARLLRSQLSSSELAILALNALSPISKNLKDLVVEFRLLKYLPETLDRRGIMARYYPDDAFAPRD